MFFRTLLVASFLLVFTATAASAYTVVMRNGRQVEIPNTFTLTKSTLTYETAPGIQITIQVASIDITATERLNGQSPGAFLATTPQPKAAAPVQAQTPRVTAARSITNADLEVYRRARLEGERERQELGLPSPEERQREVEEIDNRTQEQIREKRSQEELDFWRNRASQLEAQMNTAGAQMVGNPYIDPYGIGLVAGGFVSDGDGFHRFNRFNRFKNAFGSNNRFGFNPGFNILNPIFPGQLKSRLRFTIPKSGGGGRGGSRGGRR